MNQLKKHGFTLVELMVVVLIIMLLSAVIVVNVDNARKKGRDNKRIEDLTFIAAALQAYYADNHFYPGLQTGAGGFPGSAIYAYPFLMNTFSVNHYIAFCPVDPLDNLNGADPCAQGPVSYSVSCSGSPGNYNCSNYYGYRYTCWDSTGCTSNTCANYRMGAAVEVDADATTNPGMTQRPDYIIYDGQPCFGNTTCLPPVVCTGTGTYDP